MSNTIQVTIGLTRTDRANDYVPAMDGYQKGRPQDYFTVEIEWTNQPTIDPDTIEALREHLPADFDADRALAERKVQNVAAEVWTATNAHLLLEGLAHQIREALNNQLSSARQRRLRSLSIGDTVTVVDGEGRRATVAAASVGFEVVA